MKPKGGIEEWLYSFFNLGARLGGGGKRHAPAALPLGKRQGIRCTGSWVGPRDGMDGRGKCRPHRNSIAGPRSLQQVAIPTELSRFTYNIMCAVKAENVIL